PHGRRLARLVEEKVAAHPVDVGFLGPAAVVQSLDRLPDALRDGAGNGADDPHGPRKRRRRGGGERRDRRPLHPRTWDSGGNDWAWPAGGREGTVPRQ